MKIWLRALNLLCAYPNCFGGKDIGGLMTDRVLCFFVNAPESGPSL
jgi:hypothetical protein